MKFKLTKLMAVILTMLLLVSFGSACENKEDFENSADKITFSISCANLLDEAQRSKLPKEKYSLVPESGWLLMPTDIFIHDGESVFDVLLRTCQENKIHMEYEDTPIYDSAYIEGIGNLYEFDAGNLSGWMFSVNGEFPNYGCSKVYVHNGDIVEWVFTCDLGTDVGHKFE